jgi:hypothetical protein
MKEKILREKILRDTGIEITMEKIRNMPDAEAKELAKKCIIRLWYPDLHASKEQRYPLPQIVFRMDSPEDAVSLYEKYPGVYKDKSRQKVVEVRKRLLVQAFLEKLLPYLEIEEKRKAFIALEMLEVALNKPPRWKERLIDLGKELCR